MIQTLIELFAHLWWPLWAFAMVLQEAAAILSQSLDHLQFGQVLLVMEDAHVPLLQRRRHREHVPETTVPWHRCWHRSRWSNSQKVGPWARPAYKISGFLYLRCWECWSDWGSRYSSVFNFTESEWQNPSPRLQRLGRERELRLRWVQETSGELDRPKKEVLRTPESRRTSGFRNGQGRFGRSTTCLG